jgi:hypothetical protein
MSLSNKFFTMAIVVVLSAVFLGAEGGPVKSSAVVVPERSIHRSL